MSRSIQRINMIKQQLRTGDVLNETILNLYRDIPREDFVPKQLQHFAYSDAQLSIGHNERMMTPLEEALLLQSLNLQGHETVLEIGTGSGFLTALLSRLCKKVVSIDYYADFTLNAQEKLRMHHCDNVALFTGNAHDGWLNEAPYDVVIFTGALLTLTETQRLQVVPGGKLFAITGQAPIMEAQLHSLNHDNIWTQQLVFETQLPALIETHKPNSFVF